MMIHICLQAYFYILDFIIPERKSDMKSY